MISCLNGALEYYRTTGEPQILQACLNAWQDIVDHRLYITGASSYWEVFMTITICRTTTSWVKPA
jgi:DUF1680 family protein